MNYLSQGDDTFVESLITSEHEDLLEELEACAAVPVHARDLAVRRFFRSLTRHGELESALLFENLRNLELGHRLADEAEEAEARLAERLPPVRDFTRDPQDWDAYLGYTRRLLTEHFREEEEIFIPRAKHLFDTSEWKRLGLLYAFVETEGNGSRARAEGVGASA